MGRRKETHPIRDYYVEKKTFRVWKKIDIHHKDLCHHTWKLIFFKMFHFYLDKNERYKFHISRNGRIRRFFFVTHFAVCTSWKSLIFPHLRFSYCQEMLVRGKIRKWYPMEKGWILRMLPLAQSTHQFKSSHLNSLVTCLLFSFLSDKKRCLVFWTGTTFKIFIFFFSPSPFVYYELGHFVCGVCSSW